MTVHWIHFSSLTALILITDLCICIWSWKHFFFIFFWGGGGNINFFFGCPPHQIKAGFLIGVVDIEKIISGYTHAYKGSNFWAAHPSSVVLNPILHGGGGRGCLSLSGLLHCTQKISWQPMLENSWFFQTFRCGCHYVENTKISSYYHSEDFCFWSVKTPMEERVNACFVQFYRPQTKK